MNTLASLLVLAALAAPPVETSAVPKTRLYVKTTPPGAKVQLGDQVLGKSEGLFLVPPGVGKLVITLDGRADAVRLVELSSGRITRIEVALDAPTEGGAPQVGFGIGPILGPAPAAAVQPAQTAQPATETAAGAMPPGEGGGPIAASVTGELGAGGATGGGRGALPGLAPAGAMPGMGAAIPGAGGLGGGPGMPGMGMPGGLLGGGGGGAMGGMMPSLGGGMGGGMGGGGMGGGLAQDPPVFRLKPPQPQRPYQAPTAGRIEQALVKVGDWQGIELPLSDFVAMIRKEHGINVTLEKKAIEAAGASTDVTLNYNLKGVSLESALALVLKPKELEWSSRGDILQITTPDVASSRRSTIVYDVADLTSSAEALATIIVGQLSAGEWTDVGGGGSMAADAATGRERLVVTQSASMQRRVQGLLNSLRQASVKRPKQGGAEAVALSAEGYWRATEASAKIRAALGADAAFDFVDIPLTEAVKSLADKHAINLIVDIHELANIGVAPDSPVSLSLSDVTLDRALDELLSDLGLGYVVEHDALVITSQSEAAAPKIAVYPVGDLVADGRSVEQLSKLVHRTVLPDTWVGQNGEMLLVGLDGSQQALLVGQSTEGHRRVADLLTELRRRDEKTADSTK